MTLILDAAALVVAADRRHPDMPAVARVLEGHAGRLVVSAPVTAEVDYLLGERHGPGARRQFLADLAAGQIEVACLDAADHRAVLEVEFRYPDLDLGLADASIVVVAHRYRTDQLLTFDYRHFRAVRPLGGFDAFRLLPADA